MARLYDLNIETGHVRFVSTPFAILRRITERLYVRILFDVGSLLLELILTK